MEHSMNFVEFLNQFLIVMIAATIPTIIIMFVFRILTRSAKKTIRTIRK